MKTRSLPFVIMCVVVVLATTPTAWSIETVAEPVAQIAESGSQAGHSPVYHFDLTYAGSEIIDFGEVVGKMTVNMSKAPLPTYVLVARGLTPDTEHTFGYTLADEVYVIGSTETPKAGAFVVKGNFPIDDEQDLAEAQFWVMERPPGGDYPLINGFDLVNYGWFIAKMACFYSTDDGVRWTQTDNTGKITFENSSLELIDFGVPEGALVRVYVIVVGGANKTGNEVFQCQHGGRTWEDIYSYAMYSIYGTTFKHTLTYDYIQDIIW